MLPKLPPRPRRSFCLKASGTDLLSDTVLLLLLLREMNTDVINITIKYGLFRLKVFIVIINNKSIPLILVDQLKYYVLKFNPAYHDSTPDNVGKHYGCTSAIFGHD